MKGKPVSSRVNITAMNEVLRGVVNAERQRRGIGVRQLAALAKMHPTVVCGVLNGRLLMSLRCAERLANAMGCQLQFSLTEIEP